MPIATQARTGGAELRRRLAVGAEVLAGGGVHFRVWAPQSEVVDVVVEGGGEYALSPEEDGYFSGVVAPAAAGTRYHYRLDGGEPLPDPASRFQPEGPHGPSQVVDPTSFSWTDRDWRGPVFQGQVLYEMHVGTFTPEGTWTAAAGQLPALAELGVTVLEVMPVNEFPGEFGWGYDGVNWYAPTRLYGNPDDMRRFVDRAHALGLSVILDVVYNHLGPDGNFLPRFSSHYFSERHQTEWGTPINFDGAHCGPVREFVVANAGYWVDEFHLDGLRIDATQAIFDDSPKHILAALSERVHEAARGRRVLLVGENEEQRVSLIRPVDQGGQGLDMLWNDDFHHAARVAATGRNEGYYRDYRGTPQEFVSAAKYGFLYQGQRNARQAKRRGTPTFGIEPAAFVNFLQNHDQIGNSATGARLDRLTSPGRYRALTGLLLLLPGTPMLFQGQEFAASSPFLYFGDQKAEIAFAMHRGRRQFLAQFPALKTYQMQQRIPHPAAPETFRRSKLDPAERAAHGEATALHRDLLRLRRDDPVFRAQRLHGIDGAVLGPEAFVLRYLGAEEGDRLLVVNLGADLRLDPAAEPLLAPPYGQVWGLLWSSEDPAYGGTGTPPVDTDEGWRLPGHAAVALASRGEPTSHV
ncbi:MAG: malto-oligosyltrehalose trehalohydrolase [Isosphaeraceae bacterium]|nr:malto-oligosyltrehalose trehalohydrolase [Isosphaeraceae bacterium]